MASRGDKAIWAGGEGGRGGDGEGGGKGLRDFPRPWYRRGRPRGGGGEGRRCFSLRARSRFFRVMDVLVVVRGGEGCGVVGGAGRRRGSGEWERGPCVVGKVGVRGARLRSGALVWLR